MKKNYQSPEIVTIHLLTTNIMAGSPGTPDANVAPDATPVDPGAIESRRSHGFFDEDNE